MPTRGKSFGTRGRARSQPNQTRCHGRRRVIMSCFPLVPCPTPACSLSPRSGLAPPRLAWPPTTSECLSVSQSGGKQPASRAPCPYVRACLNTTKCCAGAWPAGRWRRAPLHEAVQACCGDQSSQQRPASQTPSQLASVCCYGASGLATNSSRSCNRGCPSAFSAQRHRLQQFFFGTRLQQFFLNS
jgi:hypothetical protein